MNSKLLIRKALTTSLMAAVFATYSMVTLASDGKPAGEIVITGNAASVVTVNGEPAKSGRTIFSSSTITTPEGAGAIVNLGKAGKLELAPNTTFTLSFDDKSASGDLSSGSVSVLNSAQAVSVRTAAGDAIELNAGETATANAGSAAKAPAPTNSSDLWKFLLVFAGAVGVIVIAATTDNNNNIGGGANTISPIR